MRTKVVVDKMPETTKDCPFAVHANDDFFPSICWLKHNKHNYDGYSFAHGRKYNCCLCEKKECDELMALEKY